MPAFRLKDMFARLSSPAPARLRVALVATLLGLGLAVRAADMPVDPLDSPGWIFMYQQFLNKGEIVFDERVKVHVPASAENSMQVPVAVDARALDDVEEIMILVDLNPIAKALSFYPVDAKPYLSTQVKLQQGSPIRGAARTKDGVWHVGGAWVDAAGGGCSAPSISRAMAGWEDVVGNVHARRWQREEGTERLRMKVMHPMDTGIAPGIPEFYVEEMTLENAEGKPVARLETFAAVSENPVFSFDVIAKGEGTGDLVVRGVDNNGNQIQARVGP